MPPTKIDPNQLKSSGGFGIPGPPGADGIDGVGVDGTNGTNGTDGKTIRNGAGAPSSGLGVDGDFYIDTVADAIYGPKSGGAWGSPTSLVGPQGEPGTASSEFEGENKDTVSIVAGGAVTIHNSGVGVRRANAGTAGRECVGLAIAATAVGLSATVRTAGLITLANWTAVVGSVTLAPMTPYYLGTTAGTLTTTAPTAAGQRVQQVGVAVAADTLVIQILQPILR